MTKFDKTNVAVKDFSFSIAAQSGKVSAHGTIEVSKVEYNEDRTIKSIIRTESVMGGSGFTVSQAFLNMLDNIEVDVKSK